MKKKPHLVVFFGGEAPNYDLSRETGYWVCQYLPRSSFAITPVHVQPDGTWQVPSGSLPERGPVRSMMGSMFKDLRAMSPHEGLKRLLQRPVTGLMSLLRGKGGDDGSLHGLARSLDLAMIGSPVEACQQTSNKQLCSDRVSDIAAVPLSLTFSTGTDVAEAVSTVRDHLTPSLFVKPVSQESSMGVEEVDSLDDLAAAITRTQHLGDVLVQERARGTELNISLIEDEHGNLTVLPVTVVVPRTTTYYDRLAKRRPGRVLLHTEDQDNNPLLAEAEAVARDVYERLGCEGYASVDLVADDESIDLLEVNVIPTFSAATPLKHQLAAAGVHPSVWLDRMIRRGLR